MTEKIKIFQHIVERILVDGFKNITMDEIASELKISKKTIYKFFTSKEAIINLVFRVITGYVTRNFNRILKEDGNAVIKLVKLSEFFLQNAAKISDKNLNYLKYQNPALWEKIDDFRTKTIAKNFSQIIEQGKKEGLIVNVQTNLLLTIYTATVRSIINPDFLVNNSISLKEAGESIIEIIFKGILTHNGIEIFYNYKNEK